MTIEFVCKALRNWVQGLAPSDFAIFDAVVLTADMVGSYARRVMMDGTAEMTVTLASAAIADAMLDGLTREGVMTSKQAFGVRRLIARRLEQVPSAGGDRFAIDGLTRFFAAGSCG